jgi:hypothetical protein
MSSIISALENDQTNTLPYLLDGGLLYMKRQEVLDVEGRPILNSIPWLCLPRSMTGELFRMIHDERGHQQLKACQQALNGVTFYKGQKLLRDYIARCPTCLENIVKHHKPYGAMQPIVPAPVPFDIITMDFAVRLPKCGYTSEGKAIAADNVADDAEYLDTLLVVVNKFTKQLGLIPGRSTWTAFDWGLAFIDYMRTCDWGVP